MERLGTFLLDFLAQFGGGRGGIENELVRTSLEGTFWAGLLALALWRRKVAEAPRETTLVWAFSLGLLRDVLLFLVFALEMLGVFAFRKSHLIFPPLEHALLLAGIVLAAGAFIRFLREESPWGTYLTAGLGLVAVDYAVTAVAWMRHLLAAPGSRFGLMWGDQLFHVSGIAMMGWAIVLLWPTKGAVRNLVIAAFSLFLLDDLLMAINLANGDHWGPVLAPIRHNLHNLAIPLLGGVYLYELLQYWRSSERSRTEREGRFQRLFADLERGVVLVQLIRDPKGDLLDYRILDINRAGESATGLKSQEVIGRLGSVALKGPRPPLLGLLDKVDRHGLDRVFRGRAGKGRPPFLIELIPLASGRIAVSVTRGSPSATPSRS